MGSEVMRGCWSKEARLMRRWWWRCLVCSGTALCLSGCQSYCARHTVEHRVKNLSRTHLDVSREENVTPPGAAATSGIQRVSYQPERTESEPRRTLEIPREIPGSGAAPLRLPAFDPNEPEDQRRDNIERLFEPLPAVPERLLPSATPAIPSLSLADLQQTAVEYSPILRRTAAEAEIARGVVIQAGLSPNPTVGYESDAVRTLATKGYQGILLSQTFITGGKLTLAQNAAAMDYQNACLALQAARIDVATQVRDAFYDTLVAHEKVRLTRALAKFTDDIYRAQIKLASGGQAAPFEPLQLRVLAMQARNSVVQAEADQEAGWRRLAAAIGQPRMVAVPLTGDVEETLPSLNFDAAQEHLLTNHTQLRAIYNDVVQARIQSELECVKPRRPDITVYGAVQKDYTGTPFNTTYNLQISVPLPIWDRNQGNILKAHADIVRGENDREATANSLIQQLADAAGRYESSRTQAANYRASLLPDQVRTYRGIYQRYQEDRDAVKFGDIIVAQQTLATLITSYVDLLNQQWQATVDLTRLLQLDDLAEIGVFAEKAANGLAPPAPVPPSLP
ncbi:MAG: TolC family protein [Planctomycetota bacterium]|nr:MAG: TolC family protein [Planctomycetota bacterium]